MSGIGTPGTTWRWAKRLALLLALAAVAWLARQAWTGHQTAQAGARLFNGQQALDASIRGHVDRLPPAATRCANCHAPQPMRQAALQAGLAPEAFAPLLNAAQLLEARARRGGPPSRYDPSSFCKLLRTGIDPAWVLLPRDMPRYELSDLQCAQLWAHLIQ